MSRSEFSGWFPMPADVWPGVVDLIHSTGRPFTKGEIIADLRWWVDAVCAPGSTERLPGRRKLAERWGVGDWTVRVMLRQTDLWLLPAKAKTFTALSRPVVSTTTTNPPPTHQPTHSERPDADSFRHHQPTNQPASLHTRVVDQNPDSRLSDQGFRDLRSQETMSRECGTVGAEEEDVSDTPPSKAEPIDPVRANDPGSNEIVLAGPECPEQQITPPTPPPGELVMLPTSPSVTGLVDEVIAHWHGKVRLYGPKAGRAWHPRRTPTPKERELLRRFVGTYGKAQAIDLIDAYHDGAPGRRNRHNDRGEEYVGIETLFKPTLLGDRLDKTAAWVEAGRPVDTEETASRGGGATTSREPEWKAEKHRRDVANRTWERLAERIGQSGGAWRPPHFDEVPEPKQWAAAAVWAGINAVGVHAGEGVLGGLGAILRTKRRDEWEIRRVFVEAYIAYDGAPVHQTDPVYVASEDGGFAFGGDR